MAIKSYLSPKGHRIIGTLETAEARADINGIDSETGLPEFTGESETFWDSQETKTNDEGKIIFLCEDGEEWTFDQLVVDEKEDEDE